MQNKPLEKKEKAWRAWRSKRRTTKVVKYEPNVAFLGSVSPSVVNGRVKVCISHLKVVVVRLGIDFH